MYTFVVEGVSDCDCFSSITHASIYTPPENQNVNIEFRFLEKKSIFV